MSRTPWLWYDPVEDETYAMEVNPFEDSGSAAIVRTTGYEVNDAARYKFDFIDKVGTLVYYSSTDIQRHSYRGRLYTQSQLEDLTAVMEKNYPLTLTDDLGRSFSVLVESFQLQRVRARNKPYKHEYNLTFIVLEEL